MNKGLLQFKDSFSLTAVLAYSKNILLKDSTANAERGEQLRFLRVLN